MTRKNRWYLIVAYCTLAVLVVLVVASCFIPVNKKPDTIDPLTYVLLIDGDVAEYPFSPNKDIEPEKYDKVNKIYNDSFSESFLVSLFSGRIGYTNRVEYYSTSKPSTSGYVLDLFFNQEQPPAIKNNGKLYQPAGSAIYYDEILVFVTQDQGMSINYFYYVCRPELNNWTSSTTRTRYYRQSFVANFDDLYDFLEETQA